MTPGTGEVRQSIAHTRGVAAVLESNAHVREALTSLLRANGWEVITPGGFLGLSRWVESGLLNAVISDCGLRTVPCGEILDLCLSGDVPVIFIGSNVPLQLAVDLLHGGATDFLEKPFPESRLLESLVQLSERQHPCRHVATSRQQTLQNLGG